MHATYLYDLPDHVCEATFDLMCPAGHRCEGGPRATARAQAHAAAQLCQPACRLLVVLQQLRARAAVAAAGVCGGTAARPAAGACRELALLFEWCLWLGDSHGFYQLWCLWLLL